MPHRNALAAQTLLHIAYDLFLLSYRRIRFRSIMADGFQEPEQTVNEVALQDVAQGGPLNLQMSALGL